MMARISGIVLVFVFVGMVGGVARSEVQNVRTGSEIGAGATVSDQFQDRCNSQVRVETLGTTELVCYRDNGLATAQGFTSLSTSTSLDNTRISISFRTVSSVSGFDPVPNSGWPLAGGGGWVGLNFTVTDEPMEVTMTLVDIGTDAGPSSLSEVRAHFNAPQIAGSVISLAGQTTQTGVFTGIAQPGQTVGVFIDIRASAYPTKTDGFGHVELTLQIEPTTCSAANATSAVSDDLIGWNNPAGGLYSVASNWDPAQVPTGDCSAGDTAVFDLVQEQEIFLDAANATAGFWRVLNSHYRVHGPARLYSDSPTDISLAISRGGWLQLTQSTLASVHSYIGDFLGTTDGRMSVLGPGTIWDNSGRIAMSNGLMTVAAGGTVRAEDLGIGTAQGQPATVEALGVVTGAASYIDVGNVLSVGGAGPGTLQVSDGGRVRAREARIGLNSNGTALISGSSNPDNPEDTDAFADLFAERLLVVGGVGPGRGVLTVEREGRATGNPVVIGSASGGRLVVDGQGGSAIVRAATSLSVIGSEQVEVEVKDGGRITAESIRIGSQASTAVADMTIRGSDTQKDPSLQSALLTRDMPETTSRVGTVVVGQTGPGQLNILGGAFADLHGGLLIGERAQGTVIVSGEGSPSGLSSLSVAGETCIGVYAPGTLRLGDATMHAVGDFIVGGEGVGEVELVTSIVSVEGTLAISEYAPAVVELRLFSSLECDTLLVGGSGEPAQGVLAVNNSFLVVTGNAQVGGSSGGGIVLLGGPLSSLSIGGTLTIGNSDGASGGGSVTLTGSTIGGGGNIVVNPSGRLTGTGRIALCSVCTINNGGSISPGLSPGTLTIEGAYEQLPGGRLEIEYSGMNPGEFDVLHVTGDVTLGGTLEIQFVGGFSPANPDDFVETQDFIEADQGIIGDYAERVFVYPDLFADFDDDGDKDLSDVAAFQNCFGLSGAELESACSRADWEADGEIGNREVRELSTRLAGPG